MSSSALSLLRSTKGVGLFAAMTVLWMGCGGNDDEGGCASVNECESRARCPDLAAGTCVEDLNGDLIGFVHENGRVYDENDNPVVATPSRDGGVAEGTGGTVLPGSGNATGGSDDSPAPLETCIPTAVPCTSGGSCKTGLVDTAQGQALAGLCLEGTQDVAVGQSCVPWNMTLATNVDPTVELDPCAEGFICAVDQTNDAEVSFTCQPQCPIQLEPDDPPGDCGAGQVCVLGRIAADPDLMELLELQICEPLPPTCNPITQTECADGEACGLRQDVLTGELFAECRPAGTLAVDETCGAGVDERCEPGTECVSDGQTSPRCFQLCDLSVCATSDNVADGGVAADGGEEFVCEPGTAGCADDFRCIVLGDEPRFHETLASTPTGVCEPVETETDN